MASTSNGAKVGVKAVQEEAAFDVDKGLTDQTALQSHVYAHLEVHDPTCQSTVAIAATDFLQTSQDGGLASATSAFGQLVNETAEKVEQELAALKVIFPIAEVKNRRIATPHYIVVMKMILRDLMLSESGISGVPHSKEYALLLSRLSGELGTTFDADSLLDPTAVAVCLGEMLTDMEATWKVLERDSELVKGLREAWGPDVVVFVRRATDNYAECLLNTVDALNQC